MDRTVFDQVQWTELFLVRSSGPTIFGKVRWTIVFNTVPSHCLMRPSIINSRSLYQSAGGTDMLFPIAVADVTIGLCSVEHSHSCGLAHSWEFSGPLLLVLVNPPICIPSP